MLLQMAKFHSFLWLSTIALYIYTHYTSSLSIHPLMDRAGFILCSKFPREPVRTILDFPPSHLSPSFCHFLSFPPLSPHLLVSFLFCPSSFPLRVLQHPRPICCRYFRLDGRWSQPPSPLPTQFIRYSTKAPTAQSRQTAEQGCLQGMRILSPCALSQPTVFLREGVWTLLSHLFIRSFHSLDQCC